MSSWRMGMPRGLKNVAFGRNRIRRCNRGRGIRLSCIVNFRFALTDRGQLTGEQLLLSSQLLSLLSG